MRNTIAFILVLTLTLFSLPDKELQSVSSDAMLSVETVEAKPGETADIALQITDNPGITAMKIDVSYDDSCLELINAEDCGLLGTSTPTFGNNTKLNPYSLCWDDLTDTDHTENGTLVILHFKVLENAESGFAEVNIKLDQNSTFNVDFEDVYFDTLGGGVEITSDEETKDPRIIAETVEAKPGETADIALQITDNPGITAMKIDVSYDDSRLELINAEDCGLLGTSTPTFGNNTKLNPYSLCWDDLTDTDHTENGTLVILHFKVLENAESGFAEVNIKLDQNSTFNVDFEDVYFDTLGGGVEVTASETVSTTTTESTTATSTTTAKTTVATTTTITSSDVNADYNLGDPNRDGIIDAVDASYILALYAKISTSSETPTELEWSTCDVNGDGFIDAVDASTVLAYYAYISTGGEQSFKEFTST